jgi:NitT/TauT family transport system ATP-binding protein
MIELKGVSKEYRLNRRETVRALAGIDLAIETGEFVALLGPSGCGKSTILHLLAGLEEASAGSVTIHGRAPAAPRAAHQLGVAFQDHALLPWRSVQSNLELPFQAAGVPVDRERIAHLIHLVGLQGFESARPRQLSGGMRQRAAIARSLALSPQLLLLDEPFGALDAVTRRHLNHELQRIWLEQSQTTQRLTTVLVTHSVEEAAFLADRIVVLTGRPGRIVREYRVPFARPHTVEQTRLEAFHRLCDELTVCLEPSNSEPSNSEPANREPSASSLPVAEPADRLVEEA